MRPSGGIVEMTKKNWKRCSINLSVGRAFLDQTHKKHTKCGQGRQALKIYEEMRERQVKLCSYTYIAALKACSSLKDLESCRQIHAHLVETRFEWDMRVVTMLVDAYAKCGSLADARCVFEKMPCRDVVSWNAMILGYAQLKDGEVALELYAELQKKGPVPDDRTFVGALKACCSLATVREGNQFDDIFANTQILEHIRAIHLDVLRTGSETSLFVGTTLVDVYAKCGSLEDARYIFENMHHRDVVCWNAMIKGYGQMEEGEMALQLYTQMRAQGVAPNDRTFVAALTACSSLAAIAEKNVGDDRTVIKRILKQVRVIHSDIVEYMHMSNLFVGTVLVDVYAKCGSLVDATCVFQKMPLRDVVSWTAMILGHAQMEEGEVALQLYAQMQQEGVAPDDRTFVGALKACCSLAELEEGHEADGLFVKLKSLEQARAIHSDVSRCGFEADIFVGTMLVNVYARCGSLVHARYVFGKMPLRDVVSWNAMIFGHAYMEEAEVVLLLYVQMQERCVVPSDRTFVGVLTACSILAAGERGNKENGKPIKRRTLRQVRSIHLDILKSGLESTVSVGNMLVDVYLKCGSLVCARQVFEEMPHRDVGSWNAMIFGCAELGEGEEALQLYTRMQQEGPIPNAWTFVRALQACSSLAAMKEDNVSDGVGVKTGILEHVRAIHSDIVKSGSELDVFVGTMLVDAYAKCGSLVDASGVFEKMPRHDVVSWTVIILGYAQLEEGEIALQFYAQMQEEGLSPDVLTFVGALRACGRVARLEKGKEIHAQISKTGLEVTGSFVASSLIDMYGRCGSMIDAQRVFDALRTQNIISWSALIAGYARQGDSELVFDLFEKMRQDGIQPDGIIFLSVLNVCSHVGLVDKGQHYFEAMSKDFCIGPSIEHYTCMVDLLGRAGQVDKAMLMVDQMPFQPNGGVWRTVLSACQKWGNVEVARQAFEGAMRLDKNDAAAYALMSNIYAAAHMWAGR